MLLAFIDEILYPAKRQVGYVFGLFALLVLLQSQQFLIAQVPITIEPKAASLVSPLNHFPQSVPQPTAFHGNLSSRDQVRMADQDIANWQRQRDMEQRIIAEMDLELEKSLNKPVEYEFKSYRGPGKKYYQNAFSELKKMLEGVRRS
jgi:hypothetical protein